MIDTELIFADLDTINKRYNALEKAGRAGNDKKAAAQMGVLTPVKKALESGKPVRALRLSKEDLELIHEFHLITSKQVMYIANVSEDDLSEPEKNPHYAKLLAHARSEGSPVIPICGKIEAEIAELPEARVLARNGNARGGTSSRDSGWIPIAGS